MYEKRTHLRLTALAAALLAGMLLAFLPRTVQAYEYVDVASAVNTAAGIRIKWNSIPGATGYRIHRTRWENYKTVEEKYFEVSAPATSWTDTNVTIGAEYLYYASAYNEQGPMEHTGGTGESTIRFLPPAAVKASVSEGVAALHWKKNKFVDYYKIQISKNSAFSKSACYRTTGWAAAKIIGLTAGQTYYARVRAYRLPEYKELHSTWENSYYYSAWSSTVKFTIPKKSAAKNSKTLQYSGSRTSLQKMWEIGPSPACIEFLNLVKANKNGSSISFTSPAAYQEATSYYILLTGDGKVLSRNKASRELCTVTIRKNADNKAYASGQKGGLKYYKEAYSLLAKAGVKSGMPAYQAAMKIEAYIRKIAGYGGNTAKHHTFYSILDSGKGVCQAYAQMFQVMCLQAGIDCRYCTGKYKGGSHAWNRFKADGKWYYIDVTFRDTAGPNAWPVSTKKLKNHSTVSILKFIDAGAHYNQGM